MKPPIFSWTKGKQLWRLWLGCIAGLLISTGAVQGITVENTELDGYKVTLKVPETPAPGKPWLWVGEFGGHLRTLENGLVAKGFHVVYMKVSNQFGSPQAMDVWEKLYAQLRKDRGLAPRPALLGISRGNLYTTAWTRRHPDRVSLLYSDNGVSDIRSWPGGISLQAKGLGSPKDWELYKGVFHFTSDQEAQEKSIRPTDAMEGAVKAGVFLISVHGTADRTVPYVDNGQLLVNFWEKSGGRVQVFAKPGGDHHPHGLPDNTPLVDLLAAEAPHQLEAK